MSIHSFDLQNDNEGLICCDEPSTHPEQIARAKLDLPTDVEVQRLTEIFKALADPTRIRIIAALMHTELCVDDLSTLLGMSQSAVSHQLRLLRHLQLVQFRKEGKHSFYHLNDDHVRDLFQRSRDHLNCPSK